MEAVAGVEPTQRQRKISASFLQAPPEPPRRAAFLCVLHVLHTDLEQIRYRALVGLMDVANTLGTVFGISAILPLELTAGLPGITAIYPVEEDRSERRAKHLIQDSLLDLLNTGRNHAARNLQEYRTRWLHTIGKYRTR